MGQHRGAAASLSRLGLALGLAAGVAALPSVVAADVAAPTPGRLRGQVRAPGLKPVPGATAAAVRAEAPPLLALTATDALGFLSMDGVPPGTWSLLVLAPGYLPGQVGALSVGGPFRAVADLTLRPGVDAAPVLVLPQGEGQGLALRTVAGRSVGERLVVDAQGTPSTPLGGVRLRLEPLGHRADPVVAETSGTGEARLPDLPAGRWRLTLGRAGWTRLVVPALETRGGAVTILARLLPLPAGAQTPVEDLLPPPRFLD